MFFFVLFFIGVLLFYPKKVNVANDVLILTENKIALENASSESEKNQTSLTQEKKNTISYNQEKIQNANNKFELLAKEYNNDLKNKSMKNKFSQALLENDEYRQQLLNKFKLEANEFKNLNK